MPKYKLAKDGCESGYESDEGTLYTPKSHLGVGSFAQADRFVSQDGRSVVVLSPIKSDSDIDFKEALVKARFFRANYPSQPAYLIKNKSDYRIVLPEVPGISYLKLFRRTPSFTLFQQLNFCGSVIAAFKKLHQAGLAFLDFHENNVHYDLKTCQSYFVDGGLSVPIGSELPPDIFQGKSAGIQSMQFPQIAPECWTADGVTQMASTKMDVYSFGVIMLRMFCRSDTVILKSLLRACSDKLPEHRPTIDQIGDELNRLARLYSPTRHIFMLAGHLSPLDKGPVLAILIELPESLILDLELKSSDSADDIMGRLVAVVTSTDKLIKTQAVRLSFIAARLGYPQILSQLKAKGVSFSEKYHDKTLVQTAIEEGNLLFVQTLADLGIPLNEVDKGGFTPMLEAVKQGHTLIVEELIKRGSDVHALDAAGQSLMHMAAQAGHVAMIDLLIGHKLDPNLPSKNGATPIYLALKKNHRRVVAQLLRYDVSLNKPIVAGKVLAELVVEEGNLAAVQILCDLGVDFKQAFPGGKFPVCLAAQKGHFSLIKFFDTLGIDFNAIGSYNQTALFHATKHRNIDLIAYLLQRIRVIEPVKAEPEVLRAMVRKSEHILSRMNKFISETHQPGLPLSLSPQALAEILGFGDYFSELVKKYFLELPPSDSDIIAKPTQKRKAESSIVQLQEEITQEAGASAAGSPLLHSHGFG